MHNDWRKITTADKNIKTLTALLLEQQANFRHPLTDIVALQSTNLTAQQIEISTAINQAVCRIYHSGKNEHLLHFFKLGSFLHQIDGRSAEKCLPRCRSTVFLFEAKYHSLIELMVTVLCSAGKRLIVVLCMHNTRWLMAITYLKTTRKLILKLFTK
ncbi:MAG: hypothetical protein HWD59_02250 [Coxiellaceae bacterium]|nr:MAG: hypothetical protein HWD59_02250 [Coxiellaceae bacterium]